MLRVLLLVPDLVDKKRVAVGCEDVAVLPVLAEKALHRGKRSPRELADLPAGRDLREAHRVVGAAADDMCTVLAERYPGHGSRVPRQRVHL